MRLARLASLRPVLQRLDDAIISRVLLKVLEPQRRGALALEHVGHPAEGVIEVPDGDADAGVDLDAGADGLFPVSFAVSLRRGGWGGRKLTSR